jgi:hypothetical protein
MIVADPVNRAPGGIVAPFRAFETGAVHQSRRVDRTGSLKPDVSLPPGDVISAGARLPYMGSFYLQGENTKKRKRLVFFALNGHYDSGKTDNHPYRYG